jgi:hypothetical protein
MGAGSSTLIGNGEPYSQRAAKAKELSDKILTLFFKNANLLKLLKLHNISECPNYVFTTAAAVQSQFQTLKIYPSLGAKGEIMFAAVSDLAPGLTKNVSSKSPAEIAELTHQRNTMCVDIGYFYVRVFQIYSALALTVIDADPVRRRLGFSSASASAPGFQMRPQGPLQAPLGGGSRAANKRNTRRASRRQQGGAIPKSGKFAELYTSINATPFKAIIGMLTPIGDTLARPQIIKLDDKRVGVKGSLYLQWNFPSQKVGVDHEVEGVYRKGSVERPVTVKMSQVEKKITFTLADTTTGKSLTQNFRQSITGIWELEYDLGESPTDLIPFYDDIHALFEDMEEGQRSSAGTSSASSSGISGVSAPGTTLSSFEGFDKLKKIFEDKTQGKEFPKAYCVARAMTLLNPIFASENIGAQPYTSQICSPKYDFETGEEYMPRPGKTARANIYLRSLVSLFYDDYKYVRGTGKLELSQTEPGKKALKDVSVEFAKLYNMPEQIGETFLSADDGKGQGPPFKGFDVCDKITGRLLITQSKEGTQFIQKLQQEVIMKMLSFQEEHTAAVNKLLMKMFKIDVGKDKQPILRLQPAVRSKGRDGINAIGREAHALLVQYYRKSEAYFIKGVLMFKENKNLWTA